MILAVARAYRTHWRVLLLAGLVVFVPLGLVELLDEHLQEPLADASLDQIDPGLLAALIAAAIGHAIGALLGEVVYAGIVAAAVTHEGERPPLGELLRELPIWRLIWVDLIWVAVVAVGFIALAIPGFIFVAWFALVAPAVEIEGRRPLEAFRRSRELVRGRFWLVFVMVVPLLFIDDTLGNLARSASYWGLGDGFLGHWGGSVAANLVASPPYALIAVFLFLGLRERPVEAPASA